MGQVGKLMILFGVIFIVLGLAMQLIGKVPGIGHLPGDIFVKKGDFTFYFPLATCLIASVILSLILSLFLKR